MRPNLTKISESARAWRWLWMPALAFLITRIGIFGVAYFSTPILADSSVPPYHLRPDNTLLDVFASRWDTGFYLSIVNEGYRYTGVRFPSVAFFPLLPILMRALQPITGNALTAGVLLANLGLLASAVFLYRLAALSFSEDTAERSVWYMLIFPVSFFGSAIYTESLFLLAGIAALYFARQHRWWAAGLCGILASLTRLLGVLVGVMLLVEWLQQVVQRRGEAQPVRWTGLAAAVLSPAGLLAYMLYLQRTFGEPLAFIRASAAWDRVPRSPFATIAGLLTPPEQGWGQAISAGALPLDNWVDLSFVLFFLALGLVLLFQRRWSEAAFVILGAAIPFSSGLLMSQRRYMWALFPAFILLARWGENPWVDRMVFVFSLLGLGLFTAMFANWYWVG